MAPLSRLTFMVSLDAIGSADDRILFTNARDMVRYWKG